jgi:hypothetical protein
VPSRSIRGGPVSSSFLYLAIVAVWAFVLVPRWLRRQHAQPQTQVEVDVEVDVEFGYDVGRPQYDDVDDADATSYADDAGADYGSSADDGMSERSRRGRQPRAPLPRSRVLQARRRLLTMLLLLTAVAVGCTTLKLTVWWVCIPPAALLGVYLLLLRETAVADADQARRRAAKDMRIQAAREREHAVAMEREEQPSAQIIDISARVADQLYDQYADATVRAVGD